MDLNPILQAVSSVGFPIVACIFLFKQNNKLAETIGDLRATMVENTTMLKIMINKMDEKKGEN